MANLFDPPPTYDLPLVKGQDLIVDFKNRVPDTNPAEYEDYADGVTVTLIIDTDPVTQAEAVIDGIHAVCRIESTTCDTIKRGLLWRCRITIPGTPTTDLVGVNGVTVRADGK